MRGQPSFFDGDEGAEQARDHLEASASAMDFEVFRADLVVALDTRRGTTRIAPLDASP